jgi:hypothetical protein
LRAIVVASSLRLEHCPGGTAENSPAQRAGFGPQIKSVLKGRRKCLYQTHQITSSSQPWRRPDDVPGQIQRKNNWFADQISEPARNFFFLCEQLYPRHRTKAVQVILRWDFRSKSFVPSVPRKRHPNLGTMSQL